MQYRAYLLTQCLIASISENSEEILHLLWFDESGIQRLRNIERNRLASGKAVFKKAEAIISKIFPMITLIVHMNN